MKGMVIPPAPAIDSKPKRGDRRGMSAQEPVDLDGDSDYGQLLDAMQRGRWEEAAGLLTVLEGRYPGAARLKVARQALALRLSAEETWSGAADRRSLAILKSRWVRVLVVANLILYTVVLALWLLQR